MSAVSLKCSSQSSWSRPTAYICLAVNKRQGSSAVPPLPLFVLIGLLRSEWETACLLQLQAHKTVCKQASTHIYDAVDCELPL